MWRSEILLNTAVSGAARLSGLVWGAMVGLLLGNQQEKVSTLTESTHIKVISSSDAKTFFDQTPIFPHNESKSPEHPIHERKILHSDEGQ